MDPEFQRILLRVMAVGGAIGAISAAALFAAFRTFRGGATFRATILIAAAIAFVLLACAALLLFSLR